MRPAQLTPHAVNKGSLRHTEDLYRVKISIALAIHSLDPIRSLDHSLFARSILIQSLDTAALKLCHILLGSRL